MIRKASTEDLEKRDASTCFKCTIFEMRIIACNRQNDTIASSLPDIKPEMMKMFVATIALTLVLAALTTHTDAFAFHPTVTVTRTGTLGALLFRHGDQLQLLQQLRHPHSCGSVLIMRSTPKGEDIDKSKSSSSFDLDKLKESFDFETLKANLPDISSLTSNADSIRQNVLNGEFGTRGEAYVLAQFALILLVAIGGIPVIGGALSVVLGPGLVLVGAATMLAGITELGPALSPWPVPPNAVNKKNTAAAATSTTNTELVVTGIFSKVRHPIYAGLLAACVGLSFITESPTRLLLTAALWYVFELKSDYEEEQLDDVYPEYRLYKMEVTGKFVPHEILDAMPWNKQQQQQRGE